MKALVVVDYQNDFVDGSLGSAAAAGIEDALCRRIEECLSEGYDLFFTMDVHGDDYLETFEGCRLPVPHCIEGTPGARVHGRVAEYVYRGTVVTKDTFGAREFMDLLSGYDEIEVCGVATNICVLANAVIARTASPGARVVVRRSCVATYDGEAGERALEALGSLQVDVV